MASYSIHVALICNPSANTMQAAITTYINSGDDRTKASRTVYTAPIATESAISAHDFAASAMTMAKSVQTAVEAVAEALLTLNSRSEVGGNWLSVVDPEGGLQRLVEWFKDERPYSASR